MSAAMPAGAVHAACPNRDGEVCRVNQDRGAVSHQEEK